MPGLNREKLWRTLKPTVTKETMVFVLHRSGFTCQMCGAEAGRPHHDDDGQRARLVVSYTVDKSIGGDDSPDNLRAICTVCDEGLSYLKPKRPSAVNARLIFRRAPIKDQLDVLAWLKAKFERAKPKD